MKAEGSEFVGDFYYHNKKNLLRLIIPIVIEQLLASTIGLADTIMVSSTGEASVAGVSNVDAINILLINVFMAVATGATVVISQYLGADDLKKANRTAVQAFWISIVISTLIAFVCVIWGSDILGILYGKMKPDVTKQAAEYFFYSALSYPFLAIYSTCAAVFRAKGNTTATMVISVIMNVINVSGNAVFIYGMSMEAGGAALASLISRVIGAGIMVFLLTRVTQSVNIRGAFPVRLHWDVLKLILFIGVPAAAESVIFQCGKVMTQNFITSFGTPAITANGVVGTIFNIALIPGNSLNIAIMTVVGYCIGSSRFREAKRYIRYFVLITMGLQLFTNLAAYLASDQILALFHLGEKTKGIASELILTMLFAVPLLWPAAFTTPAGLRAAGDVKFTMVVSIATMWLFRVAIGYLLCVVLRYGVTGVWIGMYADWLARAVIYLIRLRHKSFFSLVETPQSSGT